MARNRGQLLVGIDFGTTYSGVAWSWSERPEIVHVVTDWNRMEYQPSSSKVPSKICYKGNQVFWGFNIPPGEKPLQWFKLLLLREEDMKLSKMDTAKIESPFISETRAMLKNLGKSAEEVVSDYLGLLWKHLLEAIRSSMGASADSLPMRVVLTFPAIWPVYAQSRMRQVAVTAGIMDPRQGGETKLDLCAEPEAAAIAVMDDTDGQPVASGDIFVVCDAGGGTADLITYQLENSTRWEMAECASGAGKLCGAIFVDEAFDLMLRSWIGEKKWKRFDDATKREWKETNWEHGAKRSFNGANRERRMTLPIQVFVNNPLSFKLFSKSSKTSTKKIQGHDLLLQSADIANVFDGPVNQIVKLVLEQIQRTRDRIGGLPQAVFLVGGFGQSLYLLSRIKQEVRKVSQSIEVLRLPQERSWEAICRGALLKAATLNRLDDDYIRRPQIVSRVVRASYGFALIEPFDPLRHNVQDKQFVRSEGQECAINQMHWYVRINETIADQRVINIDWSRRIRSSLPRQRFSIVLLRCDHDDPPRRKDENVRAEGEIVCQVHTPFEHLPQYTNRDGEIWRAVDFQVEMKPIGTMLEFAVVYNNQRQHALQVNPPFATEDPSHAPPPYATPPARRSPAAPLLLLPPDEDLYN